MALVIWYLPPQKKMVGSQKGDSILHWWYESRYAWNHMLRPLFFEEIIESSVLLLRNIDLRPTSLEIASFRQQNTGFDHISLAKKKRQPSPKEKKRFQRINVWRESKITLKNARSHTKTWKNIILDLRAWCLEKGKTYSPKWWVHGVLPWYCCKKTH